MWKSKKKKRGRKNFYLLWKSLNPIFVFFKLFLIQNYYNHSALLLPTGGAVFVWYAIWLISISNDPTTDPLMTQNERNYFKSFSSTAVKEVISTE